MAKSLRLNERIRITPVRVINQHQEQLGVIPTHEALALAREAGLDLVEVSPTESPPVCRIMDYGKHLYERKKKLKTASQSHTVVLKEIRLRPKTDSHDRMIKLNHAREFLAEGNKVQFTMLFRGRERFLREIANEAFSEITKALGEAAKIERPPSMDGKRMVMIVAPGKRTGGSGSSGAAAKPDNQAAGMSKGDGKAAGATPSGPRPSAGPKASATRPSPGQPTPVSVSAANPLPAKSPPQDGPARPETAV